LPTSDPSARTARHVVAAFLRDESTHRVSSAVTAGAAIVLILFACGVRVML
jgi:hypothetical protein